MPMTRRTIKCWYLVHKWTSLACTSFLLVLCLTGLPLIFHDEVDAALGGPDAPTTAPAGAKADLDRIVAQVRAEHPGKVVTFIDWDLDDPLIAVVIAPSFHAPDDQARREFFDARTGAPLHADPSYRNVSAFLLQLHKTLFLGLQGELFLGGMGLLLLAAVVSGMVVYVPFMRKLDFATVRKDRSRRLKWLDSHNLIGIVTVAWLTVVGVTGVINTLARPAAALWQGSELVAMLKPYRSLPVPRSFASLNLIVDNALRASPGMSAGTLAFPGVPFASPRHFMVFMRGATPVTRRLIAPTLVDGETGKVVDVREMPLYVKALFLSQPLHFGDYAGLPLKILWALLDVATIVLLASGIYLWLGRHRVSTDKRVDELVHAGMQA
jgi:uncharacterized iron-regulated membrane protein